MIKRIFTEEKSITIVGTAHVLKESVKEVEEIILSERPSAVCVELDPKRYYGLLTGERMNFADMIRTRGLQFGIVAGILQYLEQKIGEEMGVFPGKEMLTAAKHCKDIGANLYLIDRDAEITIEKMTKIPLKEKFNLLKSFFLSPFQEEEIQFDLTEENIEYLSKEFHKIAPHLYHALITERNRIMAKKIEEIEESRIVAVVGAGHLKRVVERLTF